jgi:hypothetical protein
MTENLVEKIEILRLIINSNHIQKKMAPNDLRTVSQEPWNLSDYIARVFV